MVVVDQIIPAAADFAHCRDTASVAETWALGRAVAERLRGGEALLLYGPLGGGKTCFVQAICAALGVSDEVVSPTFTLVNRYTGALVVHHVDLYRIAPTDSLADIGIDDLLDEVYAGDAVLLAEWPEPLASLVPRRLEWLVLPGSEPDQRRWYLRGQPDLPPTWRELLD